jgi:two-component sensor histidine kinase
MWSFLFGGAFLILISTYFVQKDFLVKEFLKNRDECFKVLLNIFKDFDISENKDKRVKALIDFYKPAIVYVSLFSNSNKVFVARDNHHNVFVKGKADRDKLLAGENVYEYISPIARDGELGVLTVGFSQDYMHSSVKRKLCAILSKMVVGVFFCICLSGLCANFLLNFFAGALEKKNKDVDYLKDEFLSSVSHELKSPLSVIKGYVDLLICEAEKDPFKRLQLKSLSIIKESAERLNYFINNILDLVKLKTGKFQVDLVPIYIDEIANEVVESFKSVAISQKKKIVFDVDKNLPPVNGDVLSIKKVLFNLLDNAFKFTDNGGVIKISIKLSRSYGNNFEEVCVSDNGIGVSKDDIKKVFESFYQIKKNKYSKFKGSGLGLSIVAGLVKLHNGMIWIESEVGRGTFVKFVLPIVKRSSL